MEYTMSLSLQLFNELMENKRTLDDDKRTNHERIMDDYRYNDFIESNDGSLIKTVFLAVEKDRHLETQVLTEKIEHLDRMRGMVDDFKQRTNHDFVEWTYTDRIIDRKVTMQFMNHESSMDYDTDTIEDISIYADRDHVEFSDGSTCPNYQPWIACHGYFLDPHVFEKVEK